MSKSPVDFWHAPAVIAPNNFIYKSLSNWAFNVAVGCSHACRFCYVPSAATIKQGPLLAEYGVRDPDSEWGNYVLLLHVYVAIAPTYPECDETDLRTTLKAVAELEPLTIFHEPINIRAENVARIERHAEALGMVPVQGHVRTEVFATRESWQNYAVNALHLVHELAKELGIEKHLHLWPDKSLGSQALADRMPNSRKYVERLQHWWNRVSEWPE